MKIVPATYKLPVSISREIGRVMVHWAFVEQYVQDIVYLLLGVSEKQGRIAVREPRVIDRFDMIAELAYLRKVHIDASDLKSLKDRAEDIVPIRDLFAHGCWTFSADHGEYAIQNTKGPWEGRTGHGRKKKINPEGLLANADAIRLTVQKIETVIADLRELKVSVHEQLKQP